MAQSKKNFTQKPKRTMDESVERKSRTTEKDTNLNRSSPAVKQPGSSKDKLGKREASRK